MQFCIIHKHSLLLMLMLMLAHTSFNPRLASPPTRQQFQLHQSTLKLSLSLADWRLCAATTTTRRFPPAIKRYMLTLGRPLCDCDSLLVVAAGTKHSPFTSILVFARPFLARLHISLGRRFRWFRLSYRFDKPLALFNLTPPKTSNHLFAQLIALPQI